jgi:hypothetical protein
MALDKPGEQVGMDEWQIASEHEPSDIGCFTESGKKSGHWTFRHGFVAKHRHALCADRNGLSIAQREISLRAKLMQQGESIRRLT